MNRKLLSLVTYCIALGLNIGTLRAQEPLKGCGTHRVMNQLFQEHPEIIPDVQKMDREILDLLKAQQTAGVAKSANTFVIPIVFHIVHNYGVENISDAQILDALDILNEDFQKRNSDTNVVVPAFQNLIGNADIEFRLATIDPDGNCTNGIDRIASPKTYQANDGSKLNPWPRHKYLNVWIVNSIGSAGVAGYAYKPSGAAWGMMFLVDGIIILHDYVGSIGTGSTGRSRALTHEVGHWLGLDHTWGGTNEPTVACGDDGIDDTPITEGHSSCPLNSAICNPPIIENVQNFMEYSYCSRMFTIGQCALMRLTLQNPVSDRDNLGTAANLIATGTSTPSGAICTPVADFSANRWVVCAGQTINFSDQSYNAPVSSWSWTFDGGSPATSSAENPTVSFSTPGWHQVSLTASNSVGSNTVTRNTYIYVKGSAADFMGPYVEPFSDEVQFNWYYQNRNYGNDTRWWRYNPDYGYNGNGCIMMNSFGSLSGEVDEVITPAINLDYVSSPKFNFYYTAGATSSLAANLNDQLRLYVSTDCGVTWAQRMLLESDDLQNGGASTSPYYPGPNATWELKSVTLPASNAAPNVLFRLEYRAGDHPNNLFIDDINITGVLSAEAKELMHHGFILQPNPAQDFATLTTDVTKNGRVKVTISDVLGRTIAIPYDRETTAGAVQIPLNLTQLPSTGVYLLTVSSQDGQYTQRLVKQ